MNVFKWGSNTFKNMSMVPPGNGVSHQINLEKLSRFVFISKKEKRVAKTSSCETTSDEDNSMSSVEQSLTSSPSSSVEKYTLIYPDSVVGTDSHTNAVNGTGVLGWTVGGIDAESVMLGQSTRVILPCVVGYRLVGTLNEYCTSTDIVISITKVCFYLLLLFVFSFY